MFVFIATLPVGVMWCPPPPPDVDHFVIYCLQTRAKWKRLRPLVCLSIARDALAPLLLSSSPPGGRVVCIFINFQLGVLNWHQSFGSSSLIKMRMTPLGLPAFTSLAFRAPTPITFPSCDQFEGYSQESEQATKQIVLFFRLRRAFRSAEGWIQLPRSLTVRRLHRNLDTLLPWKKRGYLGGANTALTGILSTGGKKWTSH